MSLIGARLILAFFYLFYLLAPSYASVKMEKVFFAREESDNRASVIHAYKLGLKSLELSFRSSPSFIKNTRKFLQILTNKYDSIPAVQSELATSARPGNASQDTLRTISTLME